MQKKPQKTKKCTNDERKMIDMLKDLFIRRKFKRMKEKKKNEGRIFTVYTSSNGFYIQNIWRTTKTQ